MDFITGDQFYLGPFHVNILVFGTEKLKSEYTYFYEYDCVVTAGHPSVTG